MFQNCRGAAPSARAEKTHVPLTAISEPQKIILRRRLCYEIFLTIGGSIRSRGRTANEATLKVLHVHLKVSDECRRGASGCWVPPGLSKPHPSLAVSGNSPRFEMEAIGQHAPTPIFTRKRERTTNNPRAPMHAKWPRAARIATVTSAVGTAHSFRSCLASWLRAFVACCPSEENGMKKFWAASKESFEGFIFFQMLNRIKH
ncbi:hypothetical protein F5144DRAFT_124252 [Chaetomium tenue]|uniref:Uncharacterized protein n=1 Tax=Chaetomium tenue TaxID=1854479 RepID=A0ACB7PM66_9PEZI|nr:hypothetical protein F5144DRAFT_124252 [Chaetomium globosum]